MTTKVKAHKHDWRDHPNPAWKTHAACAVCGFALPRRVLAQAGVTVQPA